MARVARSVASPVGIRNAQVMMPNLPKDLDTVTDIFDRIPIVKGGSAEIGGVWATDRNLLIAEVTAQIITFQTTNNRPVIDGVIDPGGGTLKLMNQLAADPPAGAIIATVMTAPATETIGPAGMSVADVNMLAGFRTIEPMGVNTDLVRKLVRVDNSSINWYGVVIPRGSQGQGAVPHINFTPTPDQGHYYDPGYDSFASWGKLWEDYTWVIGGQVAASGANQILVIPFYKNAQTKDLGDFLTNWQEVVAQVITAALISYDPMILRTDFSFSRIVSSSFSNGFVAHMTFNSKGVGAATMTDYVFDLDGAAGGSHWTPPNGVIYRNQKSPVNSNPVGNVWYVGGRWGAGFSKIYNGNLNTHAACRNHLLYHGLFMFCT
jgi:hypothetical protein